MYSLLVKFVTLNFPEIFVDRLDSYAKLHGMKRNAVLKRAFEHLEDHEAALASVKPKERNDDAW